jgi:2-methylisocitrate lyase-like PEP mutase family enzyme
VFSVAQTVCVGRDEASFRQRAEAIGWDPDELRATAVGGTVPEVVDRLASFGAAGASRVYAQLLDLDDLDQLELLAAEVAPQL